MLCRTEAGGLTPFAVLQRRCVQYKCAQYIPLSLLLLLFRYQTISKRERKREDREKWRERGKEMERGERAVGVLYAFARYVLEDR